MPATGTSEKAPGPIAAAAPRRMQLRRGRLSPQRRAMYVAGYTLVLPAIAIYCLFVVWPLIGTFRFSLFEWNGVSPTMDFVGFGNYVSLVNDPHFWLAARNNAVWVLYKLILTVLPALGLAVAIQQVKWGQAFFRSMLFLPNLLATSVVGIVWARIYDPFIGIFGRGWLGSQDTALFALVLANSWQAFPFYMVLYVAGLQNIDRSLYEAAAIDGASRMQQFWSITLPLLKGTTTLVVVLALINAMKAFDIIWASTEGGPFFSTEVLMTWTYRLAFARDSVGLGSALSILMGVAIIVMTVVMMRLRREERS